MADTAGGSTRGFVIPLFVVAALLCCGVPISGAYLYFKDSEDESGMRAASQSYLTAVVEDDTGTAYDLLCESDRRDRSRSAWKPVSDGSTPNGFRITAISITRPAEAPTQRSVTAEITYPDHRRTEVTLHLKKQDGAWKVCAPPLL
ncbi:Rv0361 family membrane protein [Plantactinospora endophytica]|uniref:DUF4878 domain-containing protein n=1 Tax=Plantactinospora endophytica TaxID=673535 RepID=A0ABQ4E310_9ACTN|nr:hypothetical protein [Plantactinospora endophytica]GIG89095.1 hypothetical protein Pen02_40310 [Plantactinospora endophytica]